MLKMSVSYGCVKNLQNRLSLVSVPLYINPTGDMTRYKPEGIETRIQYFGANYKTLDATVPEEWGLGFMLTLINYGKAQKTYIVYIKAKKGSRKVKVTYIPNQNIWVEGEGKITILEQSGYATPTYEPMEDPSLLFTIQNIGEENRHIIIFD